MSVNQRLNRLEQGRAGPHGNAGAYPSNLRPELQAPAPLISDCMTQRREGRLGEGEFLEGMTEYERQLTDGYLAIFDEMPDLNEEEAAETERLLEVIERCRH